MIQEFRGVTASRCNVRRSSLAQPVESARHNASRTSQAGERREERNRVAIPVPDQISLLATVQPQLVSEILSDAAGDVSRVALAGGSGEDNAPCVQIDITPSQLEHRTDALAGTPSAVQER